MEAKRVQYLLYISIYVLYSLLICPHLMIVERTQTTSSATTHFITYLSSFSRLSPHGPNILLNALERFVILSIPTLASSHPHRRPRLSSVDPFLDYSYLLKKFYASNAPPVIMGPRGPNYVHSYVLSASSTTKSYDDDDDIVIINIYNARKNTKLAIEFN